MSSRLIILTIFILTTTFACQQDANNSSHSFSKKFLSDKSDSPAFHYMDEGGWMSDPKGFVSLNDECFLQYQIGEQSVSLISKDNNSWEKQIKAQSFPKNQSTFVHKGDGLPTIETIYVNDKGQVFTTMNDAPILESEFLKLVTGTKLFYEPNFKKWILIFSLSNQVLFYNSSDFTNWKHVGNFGLEAGYHGKAAWRSPDLFQMNVDGNKLRKKWVLMISTDDGHPSKLGGTQYFVGDFDGKLFVNSNLFSKVLWLDWGADNCGGLTAFNEATNEQTFVGWMNANKYDATNNLTKEKAVLTVPRKLELKDTYYGIKLFATPIKAFEKRRGSKISQRAVKLSDKENAIVNSFSSPTEFVFEFSQKSNEGYTVEFSNASGESFDFSYSGIRKMYLLNREKSGQNLFPQITKQKEHYAPRFSTLPEMNVRILIDQCSIEIFADDGLTVFTQLIFPKKPLNQMKLWGTTGQIMMNKMEIYQLN